MQTNRHIERTISINDGHDDYVEVEHVHYRNDAHVLVRCEWVVFFCQKGRPDLRNEIARFDSEPTLTQIWDAFCAAH